MAEGLDLFALLSGYERGLSPLKEAEPDPDPKRAGKLTVGLGDDLALLLTKVNPTISTEQSDAWVAIMVKALSDLPGRVSREAAQAALHKRIRFVPEIEVAIRDGAAEIMSRHLLACSRLRDMAIERVRRSTPSTSAPPPATDAEIRRMTPEIRSIGLKCGALTQEQVDRALAAAEAEAA